MSYTETVFDSCPLLRVWVSNAHSRTFQELNVSVTVLEDGISVSGAEGNVHHAFEVINAHTKNNTAKLVQDEGLAVKLRELEKGHLLRLDPETIDILQKTGVTTFGLYIYVFDRDARVSLGQSNLLENLVNKIVLNGEEVMKTLILNLMEASHRKFQCDVVVKYYGVKILGNILDVERCHSYLLQKINSYSVHHLLSEAKTEFSEDVLEQTRKQLKSRKLCVLDLDKL